MVRRQPLSRVCVVYCVPGIEFKRFFIFIFYELINTEAHHLYYHDQGIICAGYHT